jgi:hypothetical protein
VDRTLGQEGDDPSGAEFGRVPDNPVHLFNLEDCLTEGDFDLIQGNGAFIRDLQGKRPGLAMPDDGVEFPVAAVKNDERIPLLHPEDGCEIARLVLRRDAGIARIERPWEVDPGDRHGRRLPFFKT